MEKRNYIIPTIEIEEQFLSKYACKSTQSKGRNREEKSDNLRTDFQRDRDRIIHCKAFRMLKHKTQVFLSPEGDYYRTRLTHTLEVAQIARTIARALRLNEDLTEAIALGHDLGHTPYGHAGERALTQAVNELREKQKNTSLKVEKSNKGEKNERFEFSHNKQSLRVVERLEYDGKGMNLTHEVKDGILNHTSKGNPCTLEGQVVAWSDRIAYINHDIDDAIRGGIIEDIPQDYLDFFGKRHSARINSMIVDIINNSYEHNFARPSQDFEKKIMDLRKYMFENVYSAKKAKSEEVKAIEMIKMLYKYFYDNIEIIPSLFININTGSDNNLNKEQAVCDYISTMSDNIAVKTFSEIFVPKSWNKD